MKKIDGLKKRSSVCKVCNFLPDDALQEITLDILREDRPSYQDMADRCARYTPVGIPPITRQNVQSHKNHCGVQYLSNPNLIKTEDTPSTKKIVQREIEIKRRKLIDYLHLFQQNLVNDQYEDYRRVVKERDALLDLEKSLATSGRKLSVDQNRRLSKLTEEFREVNRLLQKTSNEYSDSMLNVLKAYKDFVPPDVQDAVHVICKRMEASSRNLVSDIASTMYSSLGQSAKTQGLLQAILVHIQSHVFDYFMDETGIVEQIIETRRTKNIQDATFSDVTAIHAMELQEGKGGDTVPAR